MYGGVAGHRNMVPDVGFRLLRWRWPEMRLQMVMMMVVPTMAVMRTMAKNQYNCCGSDSGGGVIDGPGGLGGCIRDLFLILLLGLQLQVTIRTS